MPLAAPLLLQVGDSRKVVQTGLAHEVNLRALDERTVAVAFDETSKIEDVDLLLK
jgi:glycine cleavage system pyridoxal-binding protein P